MDLIIARKQVIRSVFAGYCMHFNDSTCPPIRTENLRYSSLTLLKELHRRPRFVRFLVERPRKWI